MASESEPVHQGTVPVPGRHVVITPTGISFVFNEEDQRRARECLERSGEIRINFGEISLSSLTEVRRLDPEFGPPQPVD